MKTISLLTFLIISIVLAGSVDGQELTSLEEWCLDQGISYIEASGKWPGGCIVAKQAIVDENRIISLGYEQILIVGEDGAQGTLINKGTLIIGKEKEYGEAGQIVVGEWNSTGSNDAVLINEGSIENFALIIINGGSVHNYGTLYVGGSYGAVVNGGVLYNYPCQGSHIVIDVNEIHGSIINYDQCFYLPWTCTHRR